MFRAEWLSADHAMVSQRSSKTRPQSTSKLAFKKRQTHHPLCAPSSPKISCCSTILYTLALSKVKTVVVLRSNPLSASRISAEGLEANSDRMPDSCAVLVSWASLEEVRGRRGKGDGHRLDCRRVWRTRLALLVRGGRGLLHRLGWWGVGAWRRRRKGPFGLRCAI